MAKLRNLNVEQMPFDIFFQDFPVINTHENGFTEISSRWFPLNTSRSL